MRLPTTLAVAVVPAENEHQGRRQLEKSIAWTGRERLRCLRYRSRLTVAEMNYATRRVVELQAPWISDSRPGELADAKRADRQPRPGGSLTWVFPDPG